MEKITIVVPVYNTEKYLGECLESLLCQTYSDLSIICVNDGSKDNSLQVIKEYADKDKRISYLSIENSGAATARNKGIDEFLKRNDSEFITFVDSDDTVENDFIRILYSAIIDSNAEISTCDLYRGNSRGDRSVKIYTKEETIRGYFSDKIFYESPCCKLIKKSIIEKVKFNDGKRFEDTFICYKLLNEVKIVAYTNYAAYNVRVVEGSTTRNGFSNGDYDKVEAALEIYNNYKNTEFENLAYNKYLGVLYYFIIKTNAINDKVSKNIQAISDAKKIIEEKGFSNQKIKFYPLTLAVKFGFIDRIKI